MEYKVLDLYEVCGVEKPEGAVARLTCWIQTPVEHVYPTRQHPAILVLPGGGYLSTSCREAEPIAMAFYAKGYSAFVLDYSCHPLSFPVPLREAVMAMDYIRSNAGEMSIHPDKITAIGFSAGGHLCGMLGTMYDCEEVADLATGNTARPNAVALGYPVAISWGATHDGTFQRISHEDPELRKRLSLDNLARPDMPPVFLWHTRTDEMVPVRNSLILAEKLDEVGVPFAMSIYGQGQHGLSLGDATVYPANGIPPHSESVSGWVDDCIRFFREQNIGITD